MTGPTAVLDSMQHGLTTAYHRGMERLALPLGGTDGAGITTVPAYDFASYQSRYAGRLPQSPRYLLVPQAPLNAPATVRVWFTRDGGLPEESVDVVVPAGAAAGVSVPLGGAAAAVTPTLRLTRFQPQPPADQTAAAWQLVGLLGNLAKLLWVIGAEHAELAALLTDVAAQRNAASAHGASLDLLGSDLRVPRFPPRPYTWDPDTIALYHLDDRPAASQSEVVTVADDRARYQSTSHPGTNSGGRSGQPGRFSQAFGFTTGSPAQVTVPDHAEFALPAGSAITVEAVIKPDRTVTTPGAVVAKRSPLNTAAGAGWALTVGSYRGIDHNLRFSVADGTREYELFADVDLADGRSHHVAGVVDRTAGTTGLLYLDGALVASRRLDPLGALTSAEPLRIGRGNEFVNNAATDAQYAGLIDEVRLSKVARSSFHPVIGEGDDEYRRRLRMFQRWLLPTPDALLDALTELVGPVHGNPRPFVLDEGVDPLTVGTLPMRVLPAPLAPGAGIAADGDARGTEASAVGVVEDEPGFDPAWLRPHEDRAQLDFGGVADHRLMQWSVRAALGRLLDRLVGVTGSLRVLRAYDPDADDLYRAGRALLLAHETLPPGELAVHAFAAGFGWVRRTGSGEVHVAQAVADSFRVMPAPTGSATVQLPDLVEGGDLALSLDPDPGPLADAEVRWSVSRCGPGAATVTLAGKNAVLHGVTAGTLSVRAEVTRRRHTAGGSRTIRIGLSETGLGVGASIAGDGTRGVTEAAAAGAPQDDFDEVYLVTRTDDLTGQHPNVTYGTDPANRRMQRVPGLALDRLLDLLTGAGTLTVVRAYDPAGAGLLAQGRALWLRHSALTAPALAARAFAAGFDYVQVDAGPPQTVQVAVSAGEQVGVTGPAEVAVGAPVTVSVSPQADPSAVAFAADGSRAYVASRASARVTALTVAGTGTTFPTLAMDRSARVPATPVALAVAAGKLYVAHELPGTVSVLDPVTFAAGTQISTGPRPIALATAGTRLFVGCAGDRSIRAYDTGTGAQVATGTLPDAPLSLAVVPGGSTLYAVLAGNRFCPVDQTTLVAGAAVATGAGAGHAVVSPDGAKLYVSCAADDPANGTGTVRVYHTATNTQTKVVNGFPANAAPGAAAIGVDGRFLFVATSGAGRVHVVDAATDTLLAPVFTPAGPTRWLATSPAGAGYPAALVAVSAGTVVLGDPAPLGQTPQRAPRVMTAVRLGSGAGEQLSWATVPFSRGQVELSSVVSPTIQVTGGQPGSTLVRAVSVRGDHLLPYQFEVRLVPALDADPTVTLSKDQYDLVMNILNWFHPIGVEVRTDRLRAHVVELASADADLAPAYTFPPYRFPGLPAPGHTQG